MKEVAYILAGVFLGYAIPLSIYFVWDIVQTRRANREVKDWLDCRCDKSACPVHAIVKPIRSEPLAADESGRRT